MRITRTFYPVGKGGFTVEQFNHQNENYSIVYDCGGEKRDIIEREIDNVFSDKRVKIINAVFISHLHTDHCNGLKKLLDKFKIKNIFLPLLNVEQKINLLLNNIDINGNVSDFLETLILDDRIEGFKGKIIYVPESDNKAIVSENNEEIDINKLAELKTIFPVNSKITLGIEKPFWTFIPFNYKQSERSKQLNDALLKENLNFNTIEEFKTIWQENKDKLIKIYRSKSVTGDLNTNSLLLYSGPFEFHNRDYHLRINKFTIEKLEFDRFSHVFFYPSDTVGCLYMGDYNAKDNSKWDVVEEFYGNYWKQNVGIVQIPHHGSKLNYNFQMNLIPKISIIFGKTKSLNHPHSDVIKQIIEHGGMPFLVTEAKSTKITMEIY